MCRKLSSLVIVILLVSLAGGVSAADLIVSSGTTVTKNTTESFGYFMVAGRLTVEAGADLTFTGESHLDGAETTGIRPEIIMNGGSFLVNARTNMGTSKVDNGGNYAYLTMNGGTFTCTGTFKFPDDSGGEHRIYLNGGIMHCGDIEQKHDRDAVIYVGGGILRLDDITGLDCDPQGWKDNGDLLPAQGYDEVVIEYIPAGPYTEVRAIKPDPNFASNPSPPDWGAVFDAEATLSWTPGENAAKHDVYFGTDFNDVNTATDPNVLPGRGQQDSNTYDVCDLQLGKTYYWRIDEVNGLPEWKGDVWRFRVVDGYLNSIGMGLVRIPPDTFAMGSNDGEWDEKPVHNVTISREFYVGMTEVTVEQYRMFDPNYPNDPGNLYATGVSWHDANAFCEWLSNLEVRTYRLPTEAEWEYVCRAGTTTPYWSGASRPASGSANPWGLVNVHNSPREWVWDWHGEYPYEDQVDPMGPDQGLARAVRGGGLDNDDGYYARSANRAGLGPGFAGGSHNIGFRVVEANWPATAPRAYQAPFARQGIKENAAVVTEGPDESDPYFNQRPMIPTPPENVSRGAIDAAGLHPAFRGHNHSPALEVCPNGDVLMLIYTSYSEYEEGVSLMAARLRFGSNQWDMPSYMFDFPGTNDHAPMLWNDDGTLHFFWGCPRLPNANPNPYPFQWMSSTDNGATWSEVKFPEFVGSIGGHSRQPINSALRDGDTLYVSSDGSGGESVLWKSDDNGLSWYDPVGRTFGRHTTFVLLDNDEILGMGGKNTEYGSTGHMPKSISTDGAVTWQESTTPFNWLGGNQRPCVIHLESGNLFFCSDYQKSFGCTKKASVATRRQT
ncbi:MAG: SUMF1/EgtB/PvdO family nonheme iron enzyme [Planctomycetota bacterium]